MTWQPMTTAPKDRPIVVWCVDDCKDPGCCHHNEATPDGMCLYHAHAEGLAHVLDGLNVVVWGGAWEDSWEDGGSSMPDWWFAKDSDFECPANPVCWWPTTDPVL